jgi:hypothetical protein
MRRHAASQYVHGQIHESFSVKGVALGAISHSEWSKNNRHLSDIYLTFCYDDDGHV